jgi:hypothetical protein
MARAASAKIETGEVRAAFAELMRKHIPPEKIAQRIEEGMDAMETKFFQKDGEVKETRDVVAWGERREYAALAAEYGGYHVPPSRDEGKPQMQIAIGIEIIGAENGTTAKAMLIDVAPSEATEADVDQLPPGPAVTPPVLVVEQPPAAIADEDRPCRADCKDDKEYTDKMAQWFMCQAGKRATPTIVAVPPE